MESYLKFVEENSKAFNVYLKAAQDLAKILDHAACQLGNNVNSYGKNSNAVRSKAFDLFCAVCVKVGVDAPSIEVELLNAIIGDKNSNKKASQPKTEELMNQIQERLPANENLLDCDAYILARVLNILPTVINEFNGPKIDQILAAINRDLINRGADPIRPDYSSWNLNFPINRPSPNRTLKVLVVDDDIDPGFDTIMRLAGWPGLELDFYHYQSQKGSLGSESESLEIKRVCLDIGRLLPDIILMDEGMYPISGHEVTRELLASSDVVVVANSGGSGSELHAVGALTNCNKGENLNSILRAISIFE